MRKLYWLIVALVLVVLEWVPAAVVLADDGGSY